MRLCFWPTTFQADIQACAHHLALDDRNDVCVALPGPGAAMADKAIAPLPFRGRFVDRDSRAGARELSEAGFDLVVVDNHLPRQRLAQRMLVLWHGFGWRFDDLSTMRRELMPLVGDVTRPNENFCWQAFGDWDRHYRSEHSRLDPSNVAALGSAYSDWLLPQTDLARRFDRAAVGGQYTLNLERKVVLVAFTWHHGHVLGPWGDDASLLRRLVDHIASRGGVTLMRMHDRRRHTRDTIRLVEQLANEYPGSVMLKWKSSSPDSWTDIALSDVCISNYSSLLNAFYFTGKPSVHVLPQPADGHGTSTFRMFLGLPVRRKLRSAAELWKLPPEENGGLTAGSFEQLLEQVERALAAPDCCRERTQRFAQRYITAPDGHTNQRIAQYLSTWIATGRKPRAAAPRDALESLAT
jgi:hypothetical protein